MLSILNSSKYDEMKKPYSWRKISNFFLLVEAKKHLGNDNLQALQRFNLFRTLSLVSFCIGTLLCIQIISLTGKFELVSIAITLLTLIILINYFSLNFHLHHRTAYLVIISSILLDLHLLSYYSGGIRNSSIIYFGGMILTTFMLLGNKEGKIVSFLILLNLVYFYFITEIFGEHVRNIIDTDKSGHFLNLDYFISYLTGIFLLYSLSNNLESSKNIVISNVIKSKITLEQQNEELKKLSLVASNTDNAVTITKPDGTVEWVNDGFTRLTGYHFNEIAGKKTDILYGDCTNPETISQIEDCLGKNKSFSGEIQKVRKNGTSFWMQINITPILDDYGTISRFIKVESDITDRKNAEHKMAEYNRYLEKANRELDKFAYIVSHDLKAPLRAISSLSCWIEEEIGDGFTPETREHFSKIKGRVSRMEALINGILQYSKADRVKSPETQIHIGELIKETLSIYSMDKNISFDIPVDLPVMVAERMKIEQVFSNLINNAVKHNDKAKPEIKIRFEENPDYFVFSVEDNGPGIEPEYHEKVFVIFQTLKARDSFESTGVGLAIVKKIIDEAGGSIWIESEKGVYTRILFKWPREFKRNIKTQMILPEGIPLNS